MHTVIVQKHTMYRVQQLNRSLFHTLHGTQDSNYFLVLLQLAVLDEGLF